MTRFAVSLVFGLLVTIAGPADVFAQRLVAARAQRSASQGVPTKSELARHGLERQWWSQASFDPGRDALKTLSVDEDAVYVVSNRGFVTAFDAETGGRMWSVRLGGDNVPVLEPVSNDTQVLAAVGMSLVALDKTNGNVQWRLSLRGQPSAPPAVDNSNVYVGTLSGAVYAYDLRTIRRLFNDGKLPDYSFNALVWTYKAPSELSSAPISTGRSVNFASRVGQFISVAASDRKIDYIFETDGEIIAPITRSDKLAIVPSTDRNVYGIDSRNGQLEWTFASGLPVTQAPSLIGDRAYLSPGSLGLFQLEIENGTRQWTQPRARMFLSATPTTVFAADSLGNVLNMSAETGEVRSLLPLRTFDYQVSNSRTDRIFLGTSQGLIVSMREQGREFPIYHRYPDRRPLLPGFGPAPKSEEDSDMVDSDDSAADSDL